MFSFQISLQFHHHRGYQSLHCGILARMDFRIELAKAIALYSTNFSGGLLLLSFNRRLL